MLIFSWKRPKTGNIRNTFANRLHLNNSSGNIKVSKRFRRRNDSFAALKTQKNSSYENRKSHRNRRFEKILRFGKIGK